MSKHLKKWTAALALVGIFMFSGVVLFQLQTAFGWTNPPGTPPTGAGGIMVDPSTGNVGVKTATAPDELTVGGVINALDHRIKGVLTPVDGTDAVNKDYVLAQTGNALTGPLIIYGYGQRAGILPPDPGTGVPACPNGYSDILYSNSWDYNIGQQVGPAIAGGYGPFGIIWAYGSGWGDNDSNGIVDAADDPLTNDPGHRDIGATGLTYSVCSTIPNHFANFTGAVQGVIGSLPSLQQVAACATNAGSVFCNTCRICGKDIPLVVGP